MTQPSTTIHTFGGADVGMYLRLANKRQLVTLTRNGKRLATRAAMRRRGMLHVGVVAVDASSPRGMLGGPDNLFSVTTTRYQSKPLVTTGPGAGAGVAAAGVFADVLTLAEQRGWRACS